MKDTLRVLIIDDSYDDRVLYRRVLKEVLGDRLTIAEEASGERVLDIIEKLEPHCGLLDYSLPGRNGIEVLRQIRTKHPYLPVIVLTGQGSNDIAVQSIKAGAQDYITKPEITADTLGRVIQLAIEKGALLRRISEQHNALETFSRGLAHDLREPVRTIRIFAQAVCDGDVEGDEREEYMRHIRDAGIRMGLLIDTVLSYTQLEGAEATQHETFSLDEAAACAKANLSALFLERGTTISLGALPEVSGIRAQIIQVLQNLMSNAASHSAKPVHISIDAAHDGDGVRVVVRDDGAGISPEHRLKIFEPFRRFNRDNSHCGLGLNICSKIIEGHGGTLDCVSEVGVGSSFFFILPRTLAASAEASSAGAASTGVPSKGVPNDGTASLSAGHATNVVTNRPDESLTVANVLLVDDRDDDILIARAFLSGRRGMVCNFLVANDGEEGLARLHTQAMLNDPVDLILLDINMPVNGFEMLEAIAKEPALRSIPVVMCSGSTAAKDKARADALGAISYLTKPLYFAELQPIIAGCPGLRLVAQTVGPPVLTRVT